MFIRKRVEKDKKVNFALVGCGRISQKHVAAIRAHDKDCQLLLVCDNDDANLKIAEKEYGAEGVTRLEQVLKNPAIDAVILTTPSGLHAAQTIQVARSGRHVITEKPMATNWSDGKRMVEACDEAGVHLFVVKQNRHNATLQALKQAADEKRFGRIFMVSINVFWSRPQSYYDSGKWRGTWEFDGGALMNQASHYIDLLDWLIGPVESVQAYTGTLARNIQVEDSGVVAVKWRSGAMGSVNVTMLAPRENYEGSITIIGEKGLVRVGGVALNKVETWDFQDKKEIDSAIMSKSYSITSVYGVGHTPYYENVISSLKGEARALTDGREGLKSLEVLIASYISARDGRRVSLPLDY